MRARRGTVSTWVVIAALGLSVVVICGFGFTFISFVQSSLKDRQVQEREMFQRDIDSMFDFQKWSPTIQEEPVWNGDVLSLKIKLSSEETTFKDFTITTLLLDRYLPDKKMPLRVGAFGPKKPAVIVVRFPGFDGRGGKYAKLNMAFRSSDGGPPVPRHESTINGIPVVRGESTGWTSSHDTDLYIPLRASAKRLLRKN
ncbi:MAG: hypothetical protein QOJ65_792 [Fimbriimonadaceae bacterium]|jgi:hypothetical protein|nr:hypothetical protein [Fimbriimonadaceae bacterium]